MSYKIIFAIIFLPIILFIGIVTSFEDFLTSKIRNKWIISGLLYLFIVYLLSWTLYSLAIRGIIGSIFGETASFLVWNFDKWCINLTISSIVAYTLWHFKTWGAGDAKLFICYSALIPMRQYSKVYFNYYFASFVLLLAIFIPATVYLFLRSGIYFIRKFKFNEIGERIPKLIKEKFTKANKIEMTKVLLGFFVLFLSFKVLREELQNLASKILPGQNILMLMSLLMFRWISRVFKKNTRFIAVAFVLLILYFAYKAIYLREWIMPSIGNTFARIIFIMALFPIFNKIIRLYAEMTAQKTFPFAHWMFLGVLITWFL